MTSSPVDCSPENGTIPVKRRRGERGPGKVLVEARDVSDRWAAKRLGLSTKQFNAKKMSLYARGFPQPDPTTGMYDLKQIDIWMDDRHKNTLGMTIGRRPITG